ncbi:MAG: nitrate ABC transporter substrate-binding protein, partial [Burkholderiaceae bacterium]|nr:nitrate ABC transporter substrate-binding protein [Burkholderiaceae bacterium]
FAQKHPHTCRALVAAILEAGRWIDASLSNRLKTAEIIADRAYVNTSVEVINQRILGRYQNGLGRTWDDPNHMKFFNDGAVNFPYLSDGMWFLTQHRRWGLLKSDVDYLAIARQINRIDLYKEAAAAAKVSVPKDPLRTSKLIDGVVWDGKQPAQYAAGFKIHALG